MPLTQRLMATLLEQCGLPPGVVNLVNGGREVVEAICDHPDIRAVSFVGSTAVAQAVYQRGTHAGKRVQALGGAKNFVVVMPDADLDRDDRRSSRSPSTAAPGSAAWPAASCCPSARCTREARERLAAAANALKVGDGAQDRASGWARSSARGTGERVVGYIEKGVAEGATLVLDGRAHPVADRPKGFFLGPTIFDGVSPAMTIGREEIFGPVASITPVEDASRRRSRVMQAHPNANATSIFTSSGKAAREYARLATASMVGVNIGVAAPMAQFPVRRRQGQLLRRPQGARARRVRVLHGQEGRDFEVVLKRGDAMTTTTKTQAPTSATTREAREKHKEYMLPATIQYYQEPLVLTEGKGLRIKDADGNEYLDFFGGILTVSVGHANEKVNAADRRADLAGSRTSRRSTRRSRPSSSPRRWRAWRPGRLRQCFLATSGTEADETAVMLAQLSTGATRDRRAAPRLLGPLDARPVADGASRPGVRCPRRSPGSSTRCRPTATAAR